MFKKPLRPDEELPVYYTQQLLRKNRSKFIQKDLFHDLFSALRQNPEQSDSVINVLFAKINRKWLRAIQSMYVINYTINKVPTFLDKLSKRWTPVVYDISPSTFGKKYKFIACLVRAHGVYIEKRIYYRQKFGADAYDPEYVKNLVQNENNRTIIKHLNSYIEFLKLIFEIRTEDKYLTCYFAFLILISDVISYCIAIEVLAQMVLDHARDKNVGALQLYAMFFREFINQATKVCDYFESSCSLTNKSLYLRTRIESISSITKQIDRVIKNVKSIPFLDEEGDYATIIQCQKKDERLDTSLFDSEESNKKAGKRFDEIKFNHVEIDENDEDCKVYESTLQLLKKSGIPDGSGQNPRLSYNNEPPNIDGYQKQRNRIHSQMGSRGCINEDTNNDNLNFSRDPQNYNEREFQAPRHNLEKDFRQFSINDRNSIPNQFNDSMGNRMGDRHRNFRNAPLDALAHRGYEQEMSFRRDNAHPEFREMPNSDHRDHFDPNFRSRHQAKIKSNSDYNQKKWDQHRRSDSDSNQVDLFEPRSKKPANPGSRMMNEKSGRTSPHSELGQDRNFDVQRGDMFAFHQNPANPFDSFPQVSQRTFQSSAQNFSQYNANTSIAFDADPILDAKHTLNNTTGEELFFDANAFPKGGITAENPFLNNANMNISRMTNTGEMQSHSNRQFERDFELNKYPSKYHNRTIDRQNNKLLYQGSHAPTGGNSSKYSYDPRISPDNQSGLSAQNMHQKQYSGNSPYIGSSSDDAFSEFSIKNNNNRGSRPNSDEDRFGNNFIEQTPHLFGGNSQRR